MSTQKHPDSKGVCFEELAQRKSSSIKDIREMGQWTPVVSIRCDRARSMLRVFNTCMWCGHHGVWHGANPLVEHHITGDSDELCNLVSIHFHCRDGLVGIKSLLTRNMCRDLRSLLLNKWEHDKPHTDWVRLTQLRGSWWPFDELEE